MVWSFEPDKFFGSGKLEVGLKIYRFSSNFNVSYAEGREEATGMKRLITMDSFVKSSMSTLTMINSKKSAKRNAIVKKIPTHLWDKVAVGNLLQGGF